MLNYLDLKINRRKFLSLTDLTPKEFKLLLPAFKQVSDRMCPSNKHWLVKHINGHPVVDAQGRFRASNKSCSSRWFIIRHFEHNYGHGTQNLATVLAVLMFLAFTVDQIQHRCWALFRKVRAGLRTKVKLWESLRSLFKVLDLRTMEALYRRMASLYDIQLQ